MHPILKNVLAVVAGIVIGSLVNGGIIMSELLNKIEKEIEIAQKQS